MVWDLKVQEDEVKRKPMRFDVNVDEDGRRDVAERVGVVSIESMHVRLKVFRPDNGFIVKVEGRVKADVVQECVVTCDDVVTHAEDEFEAFFADNEKAISFARKRQEQDAKNGVAEVELISEKDDPESIVDGIIDLADVAVQFLSLSLEVYPRKSDAKFDGPSDEDVAEEPAKCRKNPFEALRQLKDL